MTEHREDKAESWEDRINALLDGEMDPEQAEALKAEATGDQRLAAAIIEAYQLQRAMEHVQVEPAPASLKRKLRRIPREQRPFYRQPRWALALAAIPVLAISMVMMQSRAPSQADIEQARHDLAIAFAYIDRVSGRALNRIEDEVGREIMDAVGESVIKSIPLPESQSSSQENPA